MTEPENITHPKKAPPYQSLVRFVETTYAEHGDNHQGLGYPRPEGFDARYKVYLDVIRFRPQESAVCSLLDVGCGTARLLDLIKESGRTDITYTGIDLSPVLLEAARRKHPSAHFVCGDPFDLQEVWKNQPDYVVFGGIFTVRLQMSVEEMTAYMLRLLKLAFEHCRCGLVFNVMSQHVDWQREDLFHVPFDRMAELLQTHLGRHYLFRADYGLYEYSVYLYKTPLLS